MLLSILLIIHHSLLMLYVYCLSDEVAAHMFEGVAGVAGAEPQLIEHQRMSAVVSEFAGATIAASRENVFAHERVIGRVLRQTTPLPFRFGTITSAERIESYLASQKSLLEAALGRVRGAVEMSVKIIWDVEEAMRETEAEKEAGEAVLGEGTKFLLSKQREMVGNERLKARADDLQSWLEEFLKHVVKESSVEVNPVEKLVISASHLVERGRLDAYRMQLEAARREHPELHFLTSGPWPPYSFCKLNP